MIEIQNTNHIVNLVIEGKLTQLKTSGAPGPAFEGAFNQAKTKQEIT